MDEHEYRELSIKVAKHDTSIILLKWIIGIQVVIAVSTLGVLGPWAWNISSNLAVVANNVSKIEPTPTWLLERIAKIEQKVEKNEREIVSIQTRKTF